MEDKLKFKLKKIVNQLEGHRGRHTELVTVYVPAEYNLNLIAKQIDAEKSTAMNIKSKNTRKNVLDALERISRHLKLYKGTPKNGLAIFCGNISETEGQPKIEIWAVEPPQPLRTKLYRCDQTFVLEPLKEMLEVTEVYGLVVLERKEATIGLLEGKNIRVLQKMTSDVPGKYKTGGQCLSRGSLIMKSNGEIIEIQKAHNPLILVSENFNKEETEETPLIAKWENEKEIFKIVTCYPRVEIKASSDHYFFIRTERGIEEKPLSEIGEGDYLIMPEKINLSLKDEEIDFIPIIKKKSIMKSVTIPTKITPDLARVIGYYLGDGSYEKDRLTFFEQRKEVADYYKQLVEKIFGINVNYSFRKSKNYHQLRVYSRVVAQLFKEIFEEKDKTLMETIPDVVLKSSDRSLASFIAGFFDAEGYVSSSRVALGINNCLLAKQLQFALLRLSIISSLLEYDNKRNPYSKKIRYTLEINDIISLKRFKEHVGFCSSEKTKKLDVLIGNRSNKNKIRQIVANGRDIAQIIRNSWLDTTQFRCPDFFVNKKQLSKEIFKKNIIDKISNEELKKRLMLFYLSNLIVVKIKKIEKVGFEKTVDIETKSHNFLANCLVVHNSALRFERIREGKALGFYRRIAEAAKNHFFNMAKLKGILVGGPGPTKEEFLRDGELTTALKDKVIAVKDIGYSDEHGLKLLVEASQDVLAQQEITQEKEILNKFFTLLATKPEIAAYGKTDVERALKIGAVSELLLSTTLQDKEVDEFESLAINTRSVIHFISDETEEGLQFKNLGGFGAILRFKID